jgi:predicted kinase
MSGTIIAMAGLPGTGKTTLARALAAELTAVRLDKDTFRSCLIPSDEVDYSSEQNDFCMGILFQTAAFLLKRRPGRALIIDGRPFGRQVQFKALQALSSHLGADLKVIECVCPEETVRRRFDNQTPQDHPAGNRDFSLYLRLKAQWQPIPHPRLVVDTSAPLSDCLRRCLKYLTGPGPGPGKGSG